MQHLIKSEFPRLGGTKVRELLAGEIEALIEAHHLRRDRIAVGQLLWYAVHKDDRPYRYKKITDCRMVPVVLSVVSPEDVSIRRAGGEKRRERLKRLIARLCEEAYEQEGVLSLSDLSLITGYSQIYLSQLAREYEDEHGIILPRRGTVHDIGPTMSHKAAICRKAIVDGKQTPDIARETSHDEQSVDKYLLDFERVAYAMLKHGMSINETCFTTRLSEGLVRQYADLITELGITEENLGFRPNKSQKLPDTMA